MNAGSTVVIFSMMFNIKTTHFRILTDYSDDERLSCFYWLIRQSGMHMWK